MDFNLWDKNEEWMDGWMDGYIDRYVGTMDGWLDKSNKLGCGVVLCSCNSTSAEKELPTLHGLATTIAPITSQAREKQRGT